MTHSEHEPMAENRRALVKKLEAVGWGLFLIWIGIAFLGHVGWGVGVLGVGVIVLGTQVARKYLGLPADRFGLAVGIVFALWGVWVLLRIRLDQTSVPVSLFPILPIVVGIVIVASAFRKSRQ